MRYTSTFYPDAAKSTASQAFVSALGKDRSMRDTRNVLIFGASYGSLLGAKLALAGYDVTLVCRPATAESIARNGICVQLPVGADGEYAALHSSAFPGRVTAAEPGSIDAGEYDLVALAMQEPQYRSDGVRELLDAVATARKPCMSIMNMPPPPYLARIPGIDTGALESCYTDVTVWRNFRPAHMTLCSPDPQAYRLPDEDINTLKVTLPTNFKAARFESDADTAMLREMQERIEGLRHSDKLDELPVKLKVYDSVFVPLAKWPMLVTGNYRCVGTDDARSIRDAVFGNVDASRAIYDWARELCIRLGASPDDLVPFEKYAAAAKGLERPSSAARALFSGATDIERVDRLVQAVASQKGMRSATLDELVSRVDARLQKNRERKDSSVLIS
jgi:hypothetical protein